MNEPKFLIYIPSNRNPNFLQTSLLFLHQAVHTNTALRRRLQIVVAASPSNVAPIERIIENFREAHYKIELLVGTEYLEKLEQTFKKFSPQEYPYFIKHDDDVFIPPQVWKTFLQQSPAELEQKNVLLTTIPLSTGIPSWSYFAQNFFSKQEYAWLLRILKKTRVPTVLWGHTYSKLNTLIKSSSVWNEHEYWKLMNSFGYHYRGLHPIRLYIAFTYYINQFVLRNYFDFLFWQPQRTFTKISDRYLCNNFFMMKYGEYKKIIYSKELFIDPFDEIPLNRYCLKYKKSMSFLDSAVAVHLSYNTTYDQTVIYKGKVVSGRELEYLYLQEFFNQVTAEKQSADPVLQRMVWYEEPFVDKLAHVVGKYTRRTFIYPFLESSYVAVRERLKVV